MKKINRFSVVMFFIALAGPEAVLAASMYHAIEGATHHFNNVNGQESDVYKELTGVTLGNPISYVFMRDGRMTEDESSGGFSGFSGLFSSSCQPSSAYYKVPGFTDVALTGGASNGSGFVDLSPLVSREDIGSSGDFSNWLARTSLNTALARMTLTDDAKNHNQYFHDLVLTSVSTQSPSTSVPDSTTYLLVSLGLIGMGLARCKDCLS